MQHAFDGSMIIGLHLQPKIQEEIELTGVRSQRSYGR